MPIPGIYASAFQASAPAFQGDYWALNSVTLSSTASSVTFEGIPANYTNLQLRILAQTNRGTYGIDEGYLRFNSDSASNYSDHYLYSDGTGVAAGNDTTQTKIIMGSGWFGTSTGGTFGINIVDILDYASNVKNKTVRIIGGADNNGTVGGIGGRVGISSGAWYNTSAPIVSITITPANSSAFTAYSSFALYGVK